MQTKGQQFSAWIISFFLGIAGGYVYTQLQPPKTSEITVVRATRFELINSNGQVIAFWGQDHGANRVLAFLDNSSHPVGSLTDRNSHQLLAVGILSNESPFVNLFGNDGKSRALLYLTDKQKPILNMTDERYESRLGLGFISSDAPSPQDDDWALTFRAPNVAGIGSIKDPIDHKYRGYLSIVKNVKDR